MKPTSKIIQITSTQCPDLIPVLYALCEDGTVWEKYKGVWSNQTEELVDDKSNKE